MDKTTYEVTLRFRIDNPSEWREPDLWDWAALLDLPDFEDVLEVKCTRLKNEKE